MDTYTPAPHPAPEPAAADTLNSLRRLDPARHGQPDECCGEPETCHAACGDLGGQA